MSNGDTHVRPGEVISSSLINQILDRLAALEAAQPSTPSTGGPIVIDHFEPSNEIEVGRLLAIVGSGFPFPPTATSVTLGGFGVPAEAFLDTSTSSRLEFIVPDLGSLPPRDLFVRVRNGSASAQRLYRFLPRVDATPPPRITSVHPPSQPAPTPVQIGTQAVVDGANFEANPNDNVISLQPLPNGQTYPLPSTPLVIDVAGSSTTRIVFTVPDMVEISSGMGARRVRLQVNVTTNPTPAVAEFFAFR
jgi:hypothetical protein